MMRAAVTILLLLMLAPAGLHAQPTKAELEKRRQDIMEAIQQTQDQLEATKRDKNATIGQLRALQNKLAQRQRLIGNINEEISSINNNIQSSSKEVSGLKDNLQLLKIRYAQSVRYAYKTRGSYDMLAFLFSASDFNEALRRAKYLKKYRDYRKEQADKIRRTQSQIENKIDQLNNIRTQKDMLLTAEEQQKQVLVQEKNETDDVVKSLKGREKELMDDISKNKRAAKQLDKTISDLIRREIEIARKKAEEEARRKAEEERKRKEEEARKAATYSGGMTVATGSGQRPANGQGNTGNKPATTTTPAEKPTPAATTAPERPRQPSQEALSYKLSLTPEVAALSNSFENNRGRLPWPVEKGFIAEPFGKHPHAVAEKVMIENNGLEIQTSVNAVARAVFDGTVTAVLYLPGMGQSVLVNHGQYFTVYTRLGNILVKKGDPVKIKQPIGNVILNDDDVPMIHFELWKVNNNNSSAAIDPATWIAR
jgi:murein hydrolase activator